MVERRGLDAAGHRHTHFITHTPFFPLISLCISTLQLLVLKKIPPKSVSVDLKSVSPETVENRCVS